MDDSNKPVDATPVAGAEPVPSTPAPAMSAMPTLSATKKKNKWLLPAVAVAVLVLGGGAAAYVGVIQQSPENIWKKALSTTSKGMDQLIEKSTAETRKGMTAKGSFKVETPIAIDGNIDAKSYESDSVVTGDIGYSGVRLNTELRSKLAEGQKNPDIYFKVDGLAGIDQIASQMGADPSIVAGLAELDNKWYMVDHTLLDQATATAGAAETPQLTPEDGKVIVEKVTAVMKERLFTDDSGKAVATVVENVGKEDFEGASTYHFKVQVNKETTKDFVIALKDALKETKIKDLVVMGDAEKSFEEALNFDELLKSIEDTDFKDAKADVWVDMKTKFIRNIRITPNDLKDGETAAVDFGLPYDGGDDIPFVIKISGDDNEAKGAVTLKAVINRNSLNSKLSFDVDIEFKETTGQNVKANGTLTTEITDEKVSVEKPEGAQNIVELLGGFLGGSGLDQTLPYDDSLYPEGFDPSQFENLESL